MKQRQTCDVHYCRSFTSLLISLGFIFKCKIKKINILIISSQSLDSNHFNKRIFFAIKPFLKRYFNQIIIINYERNLKDNNFSLINSSRSESIRNNLKKIKINFNKFYVENVFSGGDDFESILIKKLGYIPNFYFTEHGEGNLASAILDETNFFSIKKYLFRVFLISFLQKIFFMINLNFFYPVKYNAYLGVMQKNVSGKIIFNDAFALDRIFVDLYNVIKKLSNFIENEKIIEHNLNQKYILFNYSKLCLSNNKDYNIKLFEKIKSVIKKNHIVIFKGHPSDKFTKTKKFIKSLIFFLEKNNIKTLVLRKNSSLHNLPSQILVKLIDIKIVISDISTSVFHISNIYKDVICYLPLNFSLNNCSHNASLNLFKNKKNYYEKIAKGIKIID